MNGNLLATLGSVAAAAIAALAAIATQRSASAANTKAATTTSRADIERDAYLNAEKFWKGIVEEQEEQLADLKEALAQERRERSQAEAELRARIKATEDETHACRRELTAAQRVIQVLRAPLYEQTVTDTDGRHTGHDPPEGG